MKKCPACNLALHEIKAGEVLVDTCSQGCGGVWFDMNELKRFDEESEKDAEIIFKDIQRAEKTVENLIPRECPVCSNETLVRRSFDILGEVEIEQCFKCSGIWLDKGELGQIRSQFKTESDRIKSGDENLQKTFLTTKSELHEDAANEIANFQEEYGSRSKAIKTIFKKLLLIDDE